MICYFSECELVRLLRDETYLGAGVEKPGVGVGSLRCEQMELVTPLAFQLLSRLTIKGWTKNNERVL
jgi:hypothetical protein